MVKVPIETTSFLDRSADIAAVMDLLSRSRLVTLAGVAGVGKTRLAMRVASQCRRRFRGGVWVVELASVRDPELIGCTVAEAIGIGNDAGGDPWDLVSAYLRDRRALLVLDNCEHLADACAALATGLLRTAARLRVLATSRHMLQATGEHVWQVRPLPVPHDAGALRASHEPEPAVAALRPSREVWCAPVELFAQRAAAVVPDFTVTAEDAEPVAALCRRLDGIPLAIELAAARLATMSVTQVLAGLDDRFQLLRRQAYTVVPHHRALGATIAWSFALCEPAERALWARLCVFAGGFDLEAVEQVCAGGLVHSADLIDLLDGLVTKSVLTLEECDGLPRYRMLETLRQYGIEQLRQSGDETSLRHSHAERYLRLAEQAERGWFGPQQAEWFGWLRREHDNLREALHVLTQPDSAQEALRLAAGLWFHWVFSGRITEGRLWLDRVLALSDARTPAQARALWANAFLAGIEGNLPTAENLAERARNLADTLGDTATAASASARLGVLAVYRGEPEVGEPLLAEALARYADLHSGDTATAVLANIGLGMTYLGQADLRGAAHASRLAVTTCRARRDRILLAFSLNLLGRVEWCAGELDRAAQHLREALLLQGRHTAPVSMATAVEQLAWISSTTGDHERAAELLGAAARIWRTYGLTALTQSSYFHQPRQECLAQVRRVLTENCIDALFARGGQLTIDQVIDFATAYAPRRDHG